MERVFDSEYKTRDEARIDVIDFIEMFYNRRRRHSHLGYLSPMESWNCQLLKKQLREVSNSTEPHQNQNCEQYLIPANQLLIHKQRFRLKIPLDMKHCNICHEKFIKKHCFKFYRISYGKTD